MHLIVLSIRTRHWWKIVINFMDDHFCGYSWRSYLPTYLAKIRLLQFETLALQHHILNCSNDLCSMKITTVTANTNMLLQFLMQVELLWNKKDLKQERLLVF